MRKQYASTPIFFSVLVLCCAAAPGLAQMSPAPAMAPGAAVPHASALVKVTACNPKLNVNQSGGFVGYAPGFAGGYWGDAYGARFYQPPVTTTNPQLGVDYVNVSPKVMKSIEFGLVVNGILRAEVKDVGTFSPGAEIKHQLGISTHAFPIQGIPRCVPLRITFEDGTKWRNPALPPPNHHIYYNP